MSGFIEYFNRLVEDNHNVDLEDFPIINNEQFKSVYDYCFSNAHHNIIAENIKGHEPISFGNYKNLSALLDFVDRYRDLSSSNAYRNITQSRKSSKLFTLIQFTDDTHTKIENIFVRDSERTQKDVLKNFYTSLYHGLCVKIPEQYNGKLKDIPSGAKYAKMGTLDGDPFRVKGNIYDSINIDHTHVKIIYFKEDPCLCEADGTSLSNFIVCFNLKK